MERGTATVIALVVITALIAATAFYASVLFQGSLPTRHLLVVRGTVAASHDAAPGTVIFADMGPHCAAGGFARSEALVLDAGVLPDNATGVAYLEYEPRSPFTTAGGDETKVVFFFGSTASLASAVDPAHVLLGIEGDPPGIRVDGVPFGAGEAFSGSYTTPVQVGTDTWQVQEDVALTSLGVIPVTFRMPAACM